MLYTNKRRDWDLNPGEVNPHGNKRRDWDLNPGEVNPHGISSPAPYQARLSRQSS